MKEMDWVKEKRDNDKYHNWQPYLKTAAGGEWLHSCIHQCTRTAALDSEYNSVPEAIAS